MKHGKYVIKNFGLKVEDLDEGSRKVKGYLSSFGIKDSDNDVIYPGAFSKSIKERGPAAESNRKIAFLRMHEWAWQIGKFLELTEDAFGLQFVGQLGRSTAGEDALRDYQDGILLEHSIGFQYVEDKIKYNEKEDQFDIFELNLFEGSAVTFGANSFTPVVDVAKGLNVSEEFAKLSQEIATVSEALRKGKGTDDRLYNLEMRLNVANQKLTDLFSTLKPDPEQSTFAGKEEQKQGSDAYLFYLNLLKDGLQRKDG